LYKQVRELNKVAIKFSRALGIPVDDKNNTYLKTMLTEHYGIEDLTKEEAKNEDEIKALEEFGFQTTTKKKEAEEIMQIQKLHRFKFLFILYDLIEFDKIPESFDNYYLVYNLMGEKIKLKLATKRTFKAGVPIIPINKLRLHYFFSNYREGLMKFIEHGPLVIRLYHKNEMISKVSLNIQDFRSPDVNQKSYYCAMVGKHIS
jgi:hypothetical protein